MMMASITATTPVETTPSAVAPWWHTVLMLAALAGLSFAGARQGGLPNAHLPGLSVRVSSYFTIFAAEWLLIFFIWLALRSRGLPIGTLVSGGWHTARDFFRDFGLGIAFIVVIVAIEAGLGYLLHADSDTALNKIGPQNAFELVLWVIMSATAGFCEEYIFRGYLLRQFSAWTGGFVWGNLIQAALFGLGHSYYPKAVVPSIIIHGWLLGMLTHWRKSLRPAIFAHGVQDALGGIVMFLSKG